MENIIKELNWNDFYSNPSIFISELKKSFETTGFFFLRNHTILNSCIHQASASFEQFFTTYTIEEKMRYARPEDSYQYGYTPLRKETGEFASVADEKEFFHVFPGKTPLVFPYFDGATLGLWDQFHKQSISLMEAIAMSIGEKGDFFHQKNDNLGTSLLRGIHYPALENPVEDDKFVKKGGNGVGVGMCASKHTDINMITLLLAREAGLQLLFEGRWIPVTISDPNMLIVNCGDMLEHLTNGRYVSGIHRVVCQKNTPRFSMPYFYHVNGDFNISPLEQFGPPKEDFSFNKAFEFLDHRLRELGLMV